MKRASVVSVGGLGNQLFIWGFCHFLLEKGFDEVSIIDTWHDSHPERPFELGQLIQTCNHNITIKSSKKQLRLSQFSSRIASINSNWSALILKSIGIKNEALKSETVFPWSKNTWLFVGYFQDYRLLGDIQIILNEISTFLESRKQPAILSLKPYQAAHVRRGDYLELKETFGVLSDSYFQKQRNVEMKFVLIGDKLEEFQELAEEEDHIVLDSRITDAWDVINVLSHADHAILSNSSLSWWGGLLSLRNEGLVTVPKPWFRTEIGVPQNLMIPGFIECESMWI